MVEANGAGGDAQRSSSRQLLPLGMTANLRLPSGQKLVVNLRDLSEGGVCAVRNGSVQVVIGDGLELELIDYDRGARLMAPVTVRWLRPGRMSTMIGLQFDDVDPGLAEFIAERRG